MPKPLPEIQSKLYKSLGLETGNTSGLGAPKTNTKNRPSGGRQNLNRKDQRKAQRAQKKAHTYSRDSRVSPKRKFKSPNAPLSASKPRIIQGSILKESRSSHHAALDGDSGTEQIESEISDGISEGSIEDIDAIDEESQSDGEELDSDIEATPGSRKRTLDPSLIKPAVREKLAEDDAEIAALERKLGIKKGRKGLPQSFKDDGLDTLLGDLDDTEDGDVESGGEDSKRKRDYDEWLSAKRRKTETVTSKFHTIHESQDDTGEDSDEVIENPFSDDELSSSDLDDEDEEGGGMSVIDEESFDGFQSDTELSRAPSRPRENPYVAPTTGQVVAKYVPPSLRKSNGSEGESKSRLRRQIQGLINRLTDTNILSIVQSAEELYQNNARGDVTEVLTDTILAQVCKPESLPDQFFVLTGGFAAAIYKIIGSSFGSHLIRRVVKDFGEEYDKASAVQHEESAIPKEPSNLLTLLSQLYVFEVVGCRIVFDYMERLMADLSEINVELLLRVCRNGGRLLRRDDPQALKRISNALNRSIAQAGNDKVSTRTKFMVEVIDDLRNKKVKGKGLDSAIVSQNVVSMKKHLGQIKSQSRRLDGLTPMGVDLEDIISADIRGKWWLVGASVPVRPGQYAKDKAHSGISKEGDDGSDSGDGQELDDEDMDFVLPDYPKKARAQGLGTPAQIAIFTALMTAMDFETGYRQYLNLKLRKEEQLEIVRVLVQCVGSEMVYNPYYAAVGERACSNSRVRFAFQSRLWRIFSAMGESLFGEEDTDEMDSADGIRFRDDQRVRRVAQFYASLIADGALRISVLKPLNPAELERPTSLFLQTLLVSLLQHCRSKKPEKQRAKVEKTFGGVRETPKLAAGLDWFLQEKTRKMELVGPKALRKLDEVKEQAREVLQLSN